MRRGRTQQADHPAGAPSSVTWRGRARRFGPTLLLPHLVAILVIVVLAMAGLLATETTFTALPATIAQLWMVLNLSPIALSGIKLGVMPWGPALLFGWVIARRTRVSVQKNMSINDIVMVCGFLVGVPALLTAVAWGMLVDASSVFPVAPPPLVEALGRTVLLHAVVTTVGLGPRLWRALIRHRGWPEWLMESAGLAFRFSWWLFVAGIVLLVVLGAWGAQRQVVAAQAYHGAWGIVGMILVSILYLPNAAVSAACVLLGAEYHIGAASVSLYSIHLVDLPPLALFAAIPGGVGSWAFALLLVPAGIAGWLARKNPQPWYVCAAAGVMAALIVGAAGWCAGGALGVYGATGPLFWLAGLLALAWLGLIAVASAAAVWWIQRREGIEVGEHSVAPIAEPKDNDGASETAGQPSAEMLVGSVEPHRDGSVSDGAPPATSRWEEEEDAGDDEAGSVAGDSGAGGAPHSSDEEAIDVEPVVEENEPTPSPAVRHSEAPKEEFRQEDAADIEDVEEVVWDDVPDADSEEINQGERQKASGESDHE